MIARSVYLLASFALLLPTPAMAADQWTRFRGPNGTGGSDADHIPVEWTEADYNWRVELSGSGNSSPVIWGGRVFITSGDKATGDQIIQCLAAESGETLWEKRLPSKPHHLHSRNTYASSTPAIDAERLYMAWAAPDNYRLAALDHEGNTQWEIELGPFESQHGFGTSPIVVGESVIIASDQKGPNSFLLAVDRKTGREKWKTPREYRRTAYSTPCVRTKPDGGQELVFNSGANGISGVDPETGKINWQIDVFDKRSVSSPIVVGGLAFGSCGSGGGGNYVVAVRPGSAEQEPELVYKVEKSAPYVPTPIASGNLAFLWYDKGVVTCIEASTGETHWQKRVSGNYSGSPVRVKDRLYTISDEGECVVLAADEDFKLLARNDLGEPSRSTPAVAGNRLYLRTYTHLISLGGKE